MTTSTIQGSHSRRHPARRHPRATHPAHTPHQSVRPRDRAIREQAAYDPTPVEFASFSLDSRLLAGVDDRRYEKTRPVQSAVIPIALAGDDLIACAETGTGKTVAFVLPILQRLLTQPSVGKHGRPSRSRVLILAPTRELAVQIEDDIHGLAYHTCITSVAVYGGVGMDAQERALRSGVDIIVATPGRLQDHMRQRVADLSGIEVLVLDEADRMMDMGFWPDVRRIVSELPPERQTLLFSATLPDPVIKLTREIVREAKYVQIGSSPSGPASTINHAVQTVASAEKTQWLAAFLKRAAGPVLVFVRTKRGADRLARRLGDQGIRATALHADRSQSQRSAAVEGFRSGRFKVMVATDLAARGLDIDGITHVVNFEVPSTPEAYVHRVGRTGRAELSGQALTLVAPEERRALAALEKSVGVRLQ